MYTIVPQCKILNYDLKWEVRVLIDCILVEIMETMVTSFDLKRNNALQNNLLQFLKYLAESFDNLKIEETRNVETVLIHQMVTSCIAMVNVIPLLFI